MKNRKLYLSEFVLIDSNANLVTFNIVEIDTDKKEIVVAITDEGKISVQKFDLKSDNGRLYFEYGVMLDEIAVDDFEEIEE